MKKPTSINPQAIYFVVIFILVLASGAQMLSGDSDLGRHLTLGKYILENHRVPTTDILSHTLSGQPRPPYEWLTQVIFALAYRVLNLDGVILLTAVIIATTFTLVFHQAEQRSGSSVLAFVFSFLAAGAASIHWLPRPHIVTFLMLTIWVGKLEEIRKGKSVHLLIFPFLMLLWANLHGGFVFGILVWGAYFAGWLVDKWRNMASIQQGKSLLIVGITSLIATVITPDLWHNWEAVLNNRSTFILSQTVETMPPDLSYPATLPFLFLALVACLLFIFYWRTVSASHIFLLIGLGFMASLMARNIPLFAIASTPIICELASSYLVRFTAWTQIEGRFTNISPNPRGQTLPILIVLLASGYFAIHLIKTDKLVFQFNPQIFPAQAADWLEANPQEGNMLNEFDWGGYIMYRLDRKYPVFVDSQSDFYSEPLMREYDRVMTLGDGWQDALNKYQIEWVIVRVKSPLVGALEEFGWQILYQDNTAVILGKRSP